MGSNWSEERRRLHWQCSNCNDCQWDSDACNLKFNLKFKLQEGRGREPLNVDKCISLR